MICYAHRDSRAAFACEYVEAALHTSCELLLMDMSLSNQESPLAFLKPMRRSACRPQNIRHRRLLLLWLLLLGGMRNAFAQNEFYGGLQVGVSTLSGDATLDSYRRRGRFLVIQSAERNRVERNLREEHFGICQPAGGLHLQPQPAHPGLRSVLERNAQQLSGSAKQFTAERHRRSAGLFSPAAEPVETISICWHRCRAFLQLPTKSGLGRCITVTSLTAFFLEPNCTSCAGGNGRETAWGLDVSVFVQRDSDKESHQ